MTAFGVQPKHSPLWKKIEERAQEEAAKRYAARKMDLKRLAAPEPQKPAPETAAVLPFAVVNKQRFIKGLVAKETGVSIEAMEGDRRFKPIVRARWIAYLVMDEFLTYSLPQIGRFFGGKDHTTVLSGLRRGKELIERPELEPDFYAKVMRVRDSYYNAIGPSPETTGKSTVPSDAHATRSSFELEPVRENGEVAAV